MNNPIKRAILESMIHAAKDALDFHEENDRKNYNEGNISLVDYCNRLGCIGHDQYQLNWIIRNMNDISTEQLETLMGL